ncbi:SDR family oxidoreductase [Flavobacterium sp. MAH-1]|uniref:SDR family oxidoreductase n=1 Tax=Flavobacterium agri TaxID=2743471 RepID=A0A7Y8Y108_9FLAO|nr:SDR family oxidoreductase [Flavobacterium agri]NUY80472.1 SDR family oxidoreductase [Flavobacterium agri]NYA70497.1 SDR family oxidoreductase [Flavobacterium agri]
MSIKIVVITGVTGALGSRLADKYIAGKYHVIGISGISGKSNPHIGTANYCEIPFDLERLDEKNSKNLVALIEGQIPERAYSISLIHCAGKYFHKNEENPDVLDRSYSLHCKSLYLLSECLSRYWGNAGTTGCIVAVSSNLTKRHNDNIPYIVSKSAMNALMQGLSFRMGKFGIPCYTVLPGIFMSPMSQNTSEQKIEQIRSRSINRQIVDIEDLASFITQLEKEKKMYLSSQEFCVDYGNSLRF